MAINTDTQFEQELTGSTAVLASDSQETEKLLTATDSKEENGISKSFSVTMSTEKSFDIDQNGHSAQYKPGSTDPLGSSPLSPSRLSLGRASSTATTNAQDQSRPKDYLILAIMSCFCPVWPINIVGLVFSIMSRNSLQQGDVDGARRLGRLARLLSIACMILGIVLITIYITVNFTVLHHNY
ncbi:trafficking regulator of GLUT4 1-like [Protopterus annectens]|uniref:trafficking regulator of GLUT4 1-like n=1 Tax=Protopterus annectens TaxID=7888 RepID=UPI001CF935F4|nr:trafficking regulator of GLUT4 1-like [Protopterus annectens]